MLKKAPPMTSYERVLAFRERNPGYARRYTARRRSMAKSGAARRLAERVAAAQAAEVLAVKPVLMLPAPVECPLTAEINALRAKLAALEALPVPAAAIPPAAKSIAA